MPFLSPPRLVTTSYTADGTSMTSSDVTLTPFHPTGPTGTGFTTIHINPTVPALNSSPPLPLPTPPSPYTQPQASGTLFGTVDFAFRSKSDMHRTLSLDYCVVLSGSIWQSLYGGEETEIKAGEAVVQRGTSHGRENRGHGWCRTVFVMVVAKKRKLKDGRELEATKRGPPKL
jgi:quercetin dioxygenase-like cupin family protein